MGSYTPLRFNERLCRGSKCEPIVTVICKPKNILWMRYGPGTTEIKHRAGELNTQETGCGPPDGSLLWGFLEGRRGVQILLFLQALLRLRCKRPVCPCRQTYPTPSCVWHLLLLALLLAPMCPPRSLAKVWPCADSTSSVKLSWEHQTAPVLRDHVDVWGTCF